MKHADMSAGIRCVNAPGRQRQGGSLLLESMVAMVVFAVGVLALFSLQARAIGDVSASNYRLDAQALTSQLSGAVWSELAVQQPPTNQAVALNLCNGNAGYDYSANIPGSDQTANKCGNVGSGTKSPAVLQWIGNVEAALPGVSSANGTLPVVIPCYQSGTVTSGNAGGYLVVTIKWTDTIKGHTAGSSTTLTHSYSTILPVNP